MTVGVMLLVGVTVCVIVEEGVTVTVGVLGGVEVGVSEGVIVGVREIVGVILIVGVIEGVGVGVAGCTSPLLLLAAEFKLSTLSREVKLLAALTRARLKSLKLGKKTAIC